jgi:glycosyltransferase involved in cell wall biosynthesis
MEFKYKLSIIVPVYNVEKYLDRCVQSLINQDLNAGEYEIILINDGSTDSSGELARQWHLKESKIKLIEQDNQGLSIARNSGLKVAQGRYIMFVDSDDFIEPNVLGQVVTTAEKHDLDLLFYDSRFAPSYKLSARQPFERGKIYTGEYVVTHGLLISSVWSNLYSHDFIITSGIWFLRGILHQDVEFNCRLYPQANKIMFIDLVVYNYFVEGISSTRGLNFTKQKKSWIDDLIIVESVKNYASLHFINSNVRKVIERKMNSTLIGNLLSVGRTKDFDFVKEYIEIAEKKNIYPIKGFSSSYKTSFLIPLLNVKTLYYLYFKLYRLFNSLGLIRLRNDN